MQKTISLKAKVNATALLLVVFIAQKPYLGLKSDNPKVGFLRTDSSLPYTEIIKLQEPEMKRSVIVDIPKVMNIKQSDELKGNIVSLDWQDTKLIKTNISSYTVEVPKNPTQTIYEASEKVVPEIGSITVKKPTTTPTPTVINEPKTNETVDDSIYKELIDQYAKEYGADPAKMTLIAKCESGFAPGAVNPTGTYVGLYQFSPSTWQSNRRAMQLDDNIELRANAEEAIRTAAFKMARDGYGAWPVCGKI